MRQISVFENQEIGGRTVEPLCAPVESDNISTAVAAAVNLLWFAMNIALAQKNKQEAQRLAKMVEGILELEEIDPDSGDVESTIERIEDAFLENGMELEYEDEDDDES